jgi:hypothetical protein
MIFVGYHEEIFSCNIYPSCYVLNNGDSYSRPASDVDQAVRFVFPEILVVVLLPMLDDYSNGYTHTRSLGTAAKIKIMREPSLVLKVYCLQLMSYLCGCLRKSIRLRHGSRTIMKTSMIC